MISHMVHGNHTTYEFWLHWQATGSIKMNAKHHEGASAAVFPIHSSSMPKVGPPPLLERMVADAQKIHQW
jgi:hypothetical protein